MKIKNQILKNDGLLNVDSMYKIVSQKNQNHYKVELIPSKFPFILEKMNLIKKSKNQFRIC